MKNLTSPAQANESKQKYVWNEKYQENDLESTYSNRGGFLEENKLSVVNVKAVYDEILKRDDFGIVTLYSTFNGQRIKAYIQNTNLGYSVRPFIGHQPMPSIFVNGSKNLLDCFI